MFAFGIFLAVKYVCFIKKSKFYSLKKKFSAILFFTCILHFMYAYKNIKKNDDVNILTRKLFNVSFFFIPFILYKDKFRTIFSTYLIVVLSILDRLT